MKSDYCSPPLRETISSLEMEGLSRRWKGKVSSHHPTDRPPPFRSWLKGFILGLKWTCRVRQWIKEIKARDHTGGSTQTTPTSGHNKWLCIPAWRERKDEELMGSCSLTQNKEETNDAAAAHVLLCFSSSSLFADIHTAHICLAHNTDLRRRNKAVIRPWKRYWWR